MTPVTGGGRVSPLDHHTSNQQPRPTRRRHTYLNRPWQCWHRSPTHPWSQAHVPFTHLPEKQLVSQEAAAPSARCSITRTPRYVSLDGLRVRVRAWIRATPSIVDAESLQVSGTAVRGPGSPTCDAPGEDAGRDGDNETLTAPLLSLKPARTLFRSDPSVLGGHERSDRVRTSPVP